MQKSQQIDFEFFQNYDDFCDQEPLISKTQYLIEDLKGKMPDEVIETYLKDNTGQHKQNYTCETSLTHNTPLTERKKAPVFFIETKPLGERAISLQKWHGIVIKTDKSFFTAKLINITNKGYDEEAEFDYDEITEEDIQLIKPGAVFYWSVGYNHSSTGQRRRFSDIRFKRLPVLNKKEIENGMVYAKQTKKTIGWE